MPNRTNRHAPHVRNSYSAVLRHAYFWSNQAYPKGQDWYDEIGFGLEADTFFKIRDRTCSRDPRSMAIKSLLFELLNETNDVNQPRLDSSELFVLCRLDPSRKSFCSTLAFNDSSRIDLSTTLIPRGGYQDDLVVYYVRILSS